MAGEAFFVLGFAHRLAVDELAEAPAACRGVFVRVFDHELHRRGRSRSEGARLRGEVSLTANLSLAAEWLKDQYSEPSGAGLPGPLANYNVNRYYAGLHWKPGTR